jgi:putative oxidoreductase
MKQDALKDAGFALMRIMLAVVFLYHGAQKLFGLFGGAGLEGFAGYLDGMGIPVPQLAAFLAALAEFGGGIVLLAGIGFRFGLPPLVFTMLVASFGAHGGKFGIQNGGMEYALTLAVMVAGLILTGPGSWTLARLRSNT